MSTKEENLRAAAQLVGTILGESQVEHLLGKSPLGAAYQARQLARGRKVLLTTFNFPNALPPTVCEQFVAHFSSEGAVLLHLLHPHIVPVYEYGEQPGYAYLVTAFLKDPSLGQVLRENGRFTPQQTLLILQQLVAALDCLHDQRVMHGMLSPANVLVDGTLHARIAGLGLHTLLEMHGAARCSRPPGHLTSPQGTFLGHPAYISPERVLGLSVDGRADVYALGVMLFELLSGAQPFTGATALEIALQRLAQPVPSLRDFCPQLPQAFDVVIGRALARDPAQRFQSAGEVARAFEQVVGAQKTVRAAASALESQGPAGGQLTVPPTVNWFDEQITPSGKWQVVPPAGAGGGAAQIRAVFPPEEPSPASLDGVDPFTWWSSGARRAEAPSPAAGTLSSRAPIRLAPTGRESRQPVRQQRRRLVGLIVAGTAAGVLTAGTISFAHLLGSMQQGRLAGNVTPAAQSSASNSKAPPHPTTPPASPTARQKPTAPARPTPPAQSGTVIGSTALTSNNALRFVNPADGAASLLIHLAGGSFVACERACTHQGVAVNYDPASKMLLCPAHGAIFDPQNHFRHVSGPGSGPLASVSIQVNGDGSITTP
ncbi:MAG TPA: protein kinase [Ktedonobacteraceae bacterium]|jgi:Rieske Fe-S protein